ncbi:hypothetical protein C8R44DRAFT_779400 [Mycena epipterygia]|nr:hypothetical protein C8R44DRAFT_779400 [Mycena epipterygia]
MFMCPVPGCGSTFTRSFDLKGHMQGHAPGSTKSVAVCSWPGCRTGFSDQQGCMEHEQNAHGATLKEVRM